MSFKLKSFEQQDELEHKLDIMALFCLLIFQNVIQRKLFGVTLNEYGNCMAECFPWEQLHIIMSVTKMMCCWQPNCKLKHEHREREIGRESIAKIKKFNRKIIMMFPNSRATN